MIKRHKENETDMSRSFSKKRLLRYDTFCCFFLFIKAWNPLIRKIKVRTTE
ncbi:MAG: hypothetical protein JXB48_18210 [Candidatus Latescibacteria bacterium]|nr:hypothetical protein [Candidatus Latescibacterota bacterium]